MLKDGYCFGCGKDNPIGLHLEFKFEDDKYVAKKILPREYQGWQGIVHGGILTTMVDEAMASYVTDKYGVEPVTGTLKMRYKSPTPTEQELTITAWQESQRHNTFTMRATISTADGKVTTEATAMMVISK